MPEIFFDLMIPQSVLGLVVRLSVYSIAFALSMAGAVFLGEKLFPIFVASGTLFGALAIYTILFTLLVAPSFIMWVLALVIVFVSLLLFEKVNDTQLNNK